MPRRREDDKLNAREAQALQTLLNALIDRFRRLDPRTQLVVLALIVVAAIGAAVLYLRFLQPSGPAGPPGAAAQMLLGNPSGASTDPGARDNYLMLKPYYALSYNDGRGTPNWVSWRLASEDLGPAPRKPTFDPDDALPVGYYCVTQRDYAGSGFDRGHMCPHADRGADAQMSDATFVMTNIIPQAPNVNRKAWEELESYCRVLVSRSRDHLYITAGPVGRGGRGSLGPRDAIARGRVTVPAECWKVIVVVPDGGSGDDLAKIGPGTRVIAVLMPNDHDAVDDAWAGFRTSPAAIERETGLHFFDRLRPDIAEALRQKIDDVSIPPPQPRHERVRD